jgi:acetyltransferase-like isoleucine patch superfamily enzyme
MKIGENSQIIANEIDIHPTVEIGDNVKIECDTIKIGKFSKIGHDVKINCKNFEAGSWLFLWDRVEVGRGGCTGPNSNVKIGNHVGIFENTIINPSESIEIGDDVGIGGEVMIWTHGAWLDVTQGFPSDFGPVKIGNNVWLPARSIVLPNVTIGDDTVIGIGSVINRDLPSGCFAAGSPCKVIRENCYPRELNSEELENIVLNIIDDWSNLLEDKNIKHVDVSYDSDKKRITLEQRKMSTIISKDGDTKNRKWREFTHYDIDKKEMTGLTSKVSEDLRDYLRRRGIKIYTEKPFKSIKPEWTL